ncbi:myosin heavy chain, non-muscle-like [Anarrhichthys ocellatus]|uniref:myosin heavy chain, non-muscle-like n=1 Tax=Anarrhichthys ocellatus TaxID=433405 RepID=UPI0012ED3304|nr:myosin heavy chain, non-muscle-like [Anarrhichthys ocellatus]
MSDRVFELLRESHLSLNPIPSGRQLPRTPPPLTGVKEQLHLCNEDDDEETSSLDPHPHNRTFDFNTFGTESEPDDPNSMLKGMKDYQLTQTDLEFIEKMRVEKCMKRLQGDLEEVQRLLMKEMMPLELALASREKAQADFQMFPSCEDLTEWVKVVLKMTSPSTASTDLDAKSLLATVTGKTIRRAKEEKRIELTQMEKRVANKRTKEVQAKGQLEKQVAHEQLKVQGLMSRLSDLKSQLLQQEDVYKALEMQINAQESPEITAEEAAPEELQAAKRQANYRGKGRTKALESTKKLQDTTNQSKSTRSKPRDRRTGVKDNHGKNTSGTLKPKQKETAARTPSQEVETTAQESVGGVRGRRKPPGTSTPPLKNQSRAKAGEATSRRAAGDAGDETQHTVLRRSRRIANRAAMCS